MVEAISWAEAQAEKLPDQLIEYVNAELRNQKGCRVYIPLASLEAVYESYRGDLKLHNLVTVLVSLYQRKGWAVQVQIMKDGQRQLSFE